MHPRSLLFGAVIITAALVSACNGSGNAVPTTDRFASSVGSATNPPNGSSTVATAASESKALAVARRQDFFHATLPVAPASLKLALPESQKLTVTVKSTTDIYVASTDPKIATVYPNHVHLDDSDNRAKTATFTVTPHAVGKAFIGFIDSQSMFAIVPITVSAAKVGADKIYIVDGTSLKTYDANGTPTSPTITPPGIQNDVGDVAVDKAGKIYIANFSLDGSELTTYEANGRQTSPTISDGGPLAVDEAGKIYLLSTTTLTMQTYNADGTKSSPTISGFNNPGGIAVDTVGKIYITDLANNNVTTYNANGTRTTPTITKGLHGPDQIAVDSAGKIYVTNAYDSHGGFTGDKKVTTYNADGSQTTPTINLGASDPSGVAVDSAGKIYIATFGDQNGSNYGVTTYSADGTRTSPTIRQNVAGLAVR